MASLFKDRSSLSQSKRSEMTSGNSSSRFVTSTTTSATTITSFLPSPFGELTPSLSAADLRETAYEIFVAACRTTSGKPLTFIPSSSSAGGGDRERSPSPSLSSLSSSPSMQQRSLTSTAASKMKKALGLRSSSAKRSEAGSPTTSSGGKGKRTITVGELMRVQMRVSETVDSRIRRALLRIAAGQVIH